MPFWSLVLVAVAAFGLQVIPPATGRGVLRGATIKGRVVDAATKAPLADARVRLTGPTQRGPVLSDSAGAFEFNGLPAGTYSFVVERNGYLSTSWPDSSRWIRRREDPIRLAATANVENLTLAIERGGVVAGKVMTATGEPVSGAQVSLLGLWPPTFNRIGTTNDLGDYRVPDLPAGRYVLRAQLRAGAGAPGDTPLRAPLPTYYPGTLQRGEAQELVVGRNGAVTEANLRLVSGTLSLLDVTVTHTDGRPVGSATVSVSSMTEPTMPIARPTQRHRPRGTSSWRVHPGSARAERVEDGRKPNRLRLDRHGTGASDCGGTGDSHGGCRQERHGVRANPLRGRWFAAPGQSRRSRAHGQI